MLLKFLRSVLMTLGLLASAPAWAEDAPRFLSVIEDLPLMAALSEVGEGVQFSTSQGRIAEVMTQGRVSASEVLAFYEGTLPQLGWTRLGRGRFAREEETLELGIEDSGQNLNVRFTLAPKNKP